MSNAPITEIDLGDFARDPYPSLARMRADAPITYVPQLDATLFTRRNDIHVQEKRTDILSSVQPNGLMTRLMGQNMMRKDGNDHLRERKILFPAVSPRTGQTHWKHIFQTTAQSILDDLEPLGRCDLVQDYALPVSAEALKAITGLTAMTRLEMDGVSQAMIDGCANYADDPDIAARCHHATALIDDHINRMRSNPPEHSALAAQTAGGLEPEQTSANIKLIISGGQNEPRDAIAGTIWALITHPEQLELIRNGKAGFGDAFAEYARWISPIGMSPRRIAQPDVINGIQFDTDDRVFLMYNSACRDEAHFKDATLFDITRDTQPAISFGAGPHFCAGAAAARCLIAEIALPLLFERLGNLRLAGDVPFQGWAFRGPTRVPVSWDPS